MTDTITIIQPDDFHLHLRDGAQLASVAQDSARRFARAIVMPNLQPPVVTVDQALAYRRRILDYLPPGLAFDPLMTLYLTDATRPDEVARVAECPQVYAFKYYPAGSTTNSTNGVTHIDKVMPLLEHLALRDVPLLLHGEVTEPGVDVFDREKIFIERLLAPLIERIDGLRLVLEHITTRDAAQFVDAAPSRVAATITAHHLLVSRNAMLAEGINPHYYCRPVLKRETHRQALLAAATGGNPRFFLGTDSAPHTVTAKQSACGCAGIYTANAAIEWYAAAFDEMGALSALEDFASRNGARFYGLPQNTGRLTLRRETWRVPASIPYGAETLVPFMAGERCRWKLVE